ncbi:MAG: DUF5723 family protein [Bacteroidetes bacterium]|nr:DUF5723 family protein [Bacteroidota bacterium]
MKGLKKYFRFIAGFMLISCSLVPDPAYTQEMFGATLGNYSGVNGLGLNPTSMLNSKAYLDINILALDEFIQNNYMYMAKEDYHFINFFKPGYQLPEHPEEYGTKTRNFYTYHNNHRANAYIQQRVNGPGVMFVYGDHAFALTTGARLIISAKGVPQEIANFAYLGLNYRPQHNINYKDARTFRIGQLTWGEIGLSYAYNFHSRNYTRISAGITIRRLFGYAALFLKSEDADYVVLDDSTISVHNFKGVMGYALPLDYDNNTFTNDNMIKGKGISGDVGITYTRLSSVYSKDFFTTPCSQIYDDYWYRISVALIDLGAIRFKTHAEKYAIDNRGSYWDDCNEFDFISFHHFMDTTSYRFYGDKNASYRASSFYMWLPAALSVQFDYHYLKHWYINTSLIYGFDLGPASVARPAELAIVPRYETRALEVSLPVSLYNWEKPRIGLAIRYYYLTMGTEKLGQFFNMSNFTGMDFYLAIHYFIDKGSCRDRKTKGCQEVDYKVRSIYR